MTRATLIGLAAALGLLAGCSPATEAAPSPPPATRASAQPTAAVAHALGSVKVGDSAVCAVCAVRDGSAAREEVKATLDYKGRTYAFCSEEEKAEFISNPAKYAGAQ